jgi:thymidylate kinase
MIIAVEGPDRAGKTTLFEAIRASGFIARYVPNVPTPLSLLPHMLEVQRRADNLWRALYDPSIKHVCDRHLAVSSQVYDRLFGREPLDVSFWREKIRVVYMRPSLETLLARWTPDEQSDPKLYARALELYDETVASYPHIRHVDLKTTLEWL